MNRVLILLCCVFSVGFCRAETLAECRTELKEYEDITVDVRAQIDSLEEIKRTDKAIISKQEEKIKEFEKRINTLLERRGVSDTIAEILKENQQLCLDSETKANELLHKVMIDYKEAVDKATRPWYLDPSFYGGLLIGLLIMA